MQDSFDIIVVGGGGSGLAAAVSAAEHGASVLLLEKQGQLGGTTGIAVGSLTASGTELQRKAGIHDDRADAHEEDASQFAEPDIEARNNSALRRFFLGHAAETINWLMDLGVCFHGPSPEPPNRVPRMHNVVPNAKAYIATLQARLLSLGGHLRLNTPVVRLLQSNDNQVAGVVAEVDGREIEFRARCGTILAAGDYANSPSTIARFKGDRFRGIEGINPYAEGDGQRLVEEAGGELLNMDITYGPELRFIPPQRPSLEQLLPVRGPLTKWMGRLLPFVPGFVIRGWIRRLLVTWQHPEDALFSDGAILVNQNGMRFCDECNSPEREIAVTAQPNKQCFILLDEALIKKYSHWPHFISTAPKIAYAYVADYLKLRPDIAVKKTSVKDLAIATNIPPENLNKTADEAGLSGDVWVMLGTARAWFTTTEGGASIDQQFRVLNTSGNPISGLYAVGQNGLGGQILWGHGLHIAWAMTSGRLCGAGLAADRRNHRGAT